MRAAEDVFFENLRAISDGKKDFFLSRSRAHHFSDTLLKPAVLNAQQIMTRVHLALGINESLSTSTVNLAVFSVVLIGYSALHLPATTIVPFVFGCLFIAAPINYLANTVQAAFFGIASLRHLESIGLDLQSDIDRCTRPAPPVAVRDWREIRIENLAYRYPASHGDAATAGVGPVSFTIRRGETLFLVGGNGSGKSTLLLLLCGLLKPKHGTICVDAISSSDNPDQYREMFCGTFTDSLVFRHVLLSDGRLKNDEEIAELLHRFDLDNQVQVNQGELSRLDLSTGQRKRVALLQALAQDRDIYFFDEWAAEQSPSFRDLFYRSILPELKCRGKTVIAITHDDRYFTLADRVLKLEAGLLVSDTTATPERDSRAHIATLIGTAAPTDSETSASACAA
jgi:putative ATP-binding cassette transporter